jgi:hypothetical protein
MLGISQSPWKICTLPICSTYYPTKKGGFHKWGARQASIGWWLFHGKTLNGGRSPTARAQRGSSARLAAAGEGLAMTLQGILGVETHRKLRK